MKRAIIAIAAVVLGGWVCEGRTITVDDDGAADFATIQAAIDDSNDGDTVLVADGTYTGDGNHEIDFHGKAITVRSENGPEHCIVDCTGGGKGFYISKDFFVYGNEDANSILDGFTVSNGRGGNGGGIRCMGNPTILNCWIIGCSAGSTMSSNGGGISCDGFGFPIIKNCRIIGNTAPAGGGGISWWGAIVVNCIISGNSANWGGGVNGEPATVVINCIISGNSAKYGGGVNGVLSITNSTISGNTGTVRGGGVELPDQGVITNCKIIGNSATDGVGGVELSDEGDITNCTFAGNRGAHENALSGSHSSSAESEISNCIFQNGGIGLVGRLGVPGATLSYNNVRGGGVDSGRYLDFPGEGNIDADPCFADPGYWDANGTPEDADDDFWIEGDYHLKSQAGRYDPNEGGWTTDEVTSLCIDAGDQNSPIGFELFPNGGLINMGAYGGTAEASKSWFGGPPCETIVAGDIDGNCLVDFSDFRLMALHWMWED